MATKSNFYSESRSEIHNLFICGIPVVFISQGVWHVEELLMPQCDFEKLLLEAVDEGLSSLGNSSKQAIYYHLKKSFNIKKQEIPYKIEAFAGAIEKIFGLGANFLEILIMKWLYEKFEPIFKWDKPEDNFTFTENVAFAKLSFLEKKKRAEELIQCEETLMENLNIYETA